MTLEPIIAESCPLLRGVAEAETVQAEFNKCVDRLDLVDMTFPALLDQLEKEVKRTPPRQTMNDVRDRLTRPRYRVGFVGKTQLGKSTTIKRILGVGDDESPTQEGGGKATTSTIMRLVPDPKANHHALTLRYLTPDQYRDKRDGLCRIVRLDPDLADQELLRAIPVRKTELKSGAIDDDEQKVLIGDLVQLEALLRAKAVHGSSYVLKEPRVKTDVLYPDRSRFLNYTEQSDPSVPLLREAEIRFRTEAIPAELEMIDMPGLGAQQQVEAILTDAFIQELDGALVFFRADQLGDADAEYILTRLRRVFGGDFAGRVWLVITKMDSLAANALRGNTDGASFFGSVADLLDRHKIPARNICLITNESWLWDSEALKGFLKGKLGGNEAVPAKFRDYDALSPLEKKQVNCEEHKTLGERFDMLFGNGGITELKRMITDTLANDVRGGVCRWASKRIEEVHSVVVQAAEIEARRLFHTNETLQVARECQTFVLTATANLTGRTGAYTEAALALQRDLKTEFKKVCPPAALFQSGQITLASQFPIDSHALETQLHYQIEQLVLPSLYGEIQAILDAAATVEVLTYQSLGAAWRDFAAVDLLDRSWRNGNFPTFLFPGLFSRVDRQSVSALNGETYHEMMAEKIAVVSQQAVHAVRRRVKERVDSLTNFLARVIRDAHATQAGGGALRPDSGRYKDVLERLKAR